MSRRDFYTGWLLGAIEGEGSIAAIHPKAAASFPRIYIYNTDPTFTEAAYRILGELGFHPSKGTVTRDVTPGMIDGRVVRRTLVCSVTQINKLDDIRRFLKLIQRYPLQSNKSKKRILAIQEEIERRDIHIRGLIKVRKRALSLQRKGYSQRQIAETVGRSQSWVSLFLSGKLSLLPRKSESWSSLRNQWGSSSTGPSPGTR